MKRREIIVILAGVIIAGLCWWRISWAPHSADVRHQAVPEQRPAPVVELYDQNSRRVSLQAFLHRHPIVLVFFDRAEGPDGNPTLRRLREVYPALQKSGIQVVAVSNMLPQEVREQASVTYPFPILADILAGQPGSASQLYGSIMGGGPTAAVSPTGNVPDSASLPGSGQSGGPPSTTLRSATFFINRLGLVNWHGDRPEPEENPDLLISDLLAGKR